MNTPVYDCWEKCARRMIQTIWKHVSAWIFHEPVDPIKLGIPDYANVVKNPMDLTTIKGKLNSGKYYRMKEFNDDMNLMFDNCLLYNGEHSQVSKMALVVRAEFKKLQEQLSTDYYLMDETTREPEHAAAE